MFAIVFSLNFQLLTGLFEVKVSFMAKKSGGNYYLFAQKLSVLRQHIIKVYPDMQNLSSSLLNLPSQCYLYFCFPIFPFKKGALELLPLSQDLYILYHLSI